MKYIYEMTEDQSTWIHELKEINDRLLFLGQRFEEEHDEHQEAFFRAQAAVCDCISQVLDHVPFEEKPSNLIEAIENKQELEKENERK